MNNIPTVFKTTDNPYFAVDPTGVVWSLKLSRVTNSTIMKSGAKVVFQATPTGTKTFYVHRLVATAFLPIPDSVLAATDTPEVLQRDGNKGNVSLDNLEWVVSIRKAGQEQAFRKVAAKNLVTGEECLYYTVGAAAAKHGVNSKRLKRHLDSDLAGLITKDYWVFVWDGTIYPNTEHVELMESRWDYPEGLWYFVNDTLINSCTSLEQGCLKLGINFTVARYKVRNDGNTYNLQGYQIYYSLLPNQIDLVENVTSVAEKKFSIAKPIRIVNTVSSTIIEYSSIKEASRQTGIPSRTIESALQSKQGIHLNNYITYIP